MITSPTTDTLAPLWVEALHEVNKVTQDSSGHHGKYATLGACLDVVKPVLAERGMAVQQYCTESERGVCVRTRIWHTSGEWIEDEGLTMPAPSDPQKVGGAVTYARRYALTTFFSITTTDDDAHEATQHVRNPQPAQEAAQAAPVEEVPESAARQVFNALKRYKGTPVAEQLKTWASENEVTLTLRALEASDDTCTLVAEKLADAIEAQA